MHRGDGTTSQLIKGRGRGGVRLALSVCLSLFFRFLSRLQPSTKATHARQTAVHNSIVRREGDREATRGAAAGPSSFFFMFFPILCKKAACPPLPFPTKLKPETQAEKAMPSPARQEQPRRAALQAEAMEGCQRRHTLGGQQQQPRLLPRHTPACAASIRTRQAVRRARSK